MLLGIEYLAAVVAAGEVTEFLANPPDPEFFTEHERKVFAQVRGHVQAHHVLPAPETFSTFTAQLGLGVPTTAEPPSFYMEQMQRRFLHEQMIDTLTKANTHLQNNDQKKALSELTDAAMRLSLKSQQRHIADFRDSKAVLKNHYLEALQGGPKGGIKTGWPSYDAMTAGLLPGDVLSIVGRPASGKTFLGLWIAYCAWLAGKTPMFISMEMLPNLILQRLISIHAQANASHVKTGMMASDEYQAITHSLTGLEDKPPFWVIDGNLSASVDDAYNLAMQLQPDFVVIDGAYLMRPSNRTGYMDFYKRVTETTENIKKQLATALGLPCVLSFQFNRESKKIKKDEEPGLEHIAGSDAVGQLSSVVLGLMQPETPETLVKRKVSVLKGRSGETGSFDIYWDFVNTNFSEVPMTEDVYQLQYV